MLKQIQQSARTTTVDRREQITGSNQVKAENHVVLYSKSE